MNQINLPRGDCPNMCVSGVMLLLLTQRFVLALYSGRSPERLSLPLASSEGTVPDNSQLLIDVITTSASRRPE